MGRITTITVLLILMGSSFAHADGEICPSYKPKVWDQLNESAFSKEAVKKQIKSLNKYFDGEIEVADEYLYHSLMIIKGGYFRNEVDKWKNDSFNYEHAKKTFCEFMENEARIVH